MSMRTTVCWLALFTVLGLYGGGIFDQGEDHPAGRLATVTRVVDGDTIKVTLDGEAETVRYIGIDTPETKKPNTPVQCYGPAASERNKQLISHRTVRLSFDRERRDHFGRLLAYVYRTSDSLFVNRALVRDGFARTLVFPPNTAHASEFDQLQSRAKTAKKGLWKVC